MATTVDHLQVVLGAKVRGFKKKMKSAGRAMEHAQRKMERAGQKMQFVGGRLTAGLTLPILGAGAAALTAAGDFEKLEKGLEALMGSEQAAARELAKLRKEAKKPGLGFEQAIRGSLALQSVEFSADTAREAISEFGNALALSGGSADDLGEVIRQLSQIQSLGKITAENMNVIRERVPLVGRAMQSAFGTTSIEAIRETGIETDEFIKRLIGGLSEIERAQGGLSNSFTNLRMTLTSGLASIGKRLNKAFDVQGKIDAVSAKVEQLIGWFESLDARTQRVIFVVAGLAAALPPLIALLGTLVGTVLPALVAGLAALTGPVGLTIAAVTALAAAAYRLYQRWDFAVAKIKRLFIQMKGVIIAKIAAVLVKLDDLFGEVPGIGPLFEKAAGRAKEALQGVRQELQNATTEMGFAQAIAQGLFQKGFEGENSSLGQSLAQIAAGGDQAATAIDRVIRAQARLRGVLKGGGGGAHGGGPSDPKPPGGPAPPQDYAASGVQRLDMLRAKAVEVGRVMKEQLRPAPETPEGFQRIATYAEFLRQRLIGVGETLRSVALQSFARGVGDVFGRAVLKAQSFKDVLYSVGDVAKQVLAQLVSMVAQAAVLSAITGNPFGSTFTGLFGGARATGGSLLPGKEYIVGERGPERIRMGGRGHATPMQQMRKAARVQVALQPSLRYDGSGLRVMLQEVLREEKRAGRL